MKKETVDLYNEKYGFLKEPVCHMSEEKFKAFKNSLFKNAKSVSEVIAVSTLSAIMNGWRAE